MFVSDEERKEWEKILEKNRDGLSGSLIFLQIWNDTIMKEPLPCMQLGLAIMLDKPVYLLVPEGSQLPENMRRLAHGLEFYRSGDSNDLKEASIRLLEKIPK